MCSSDLRGGRRGASTALQPRLDGRKVAPLETAADAPRIGALTVALLREQQRADTVAAALRQCEAQDDEVVRLRGVDPGTLSCSNLQS